MSGPQVTIDQGTLQGSTGTDIRGNSFYKFQGIPYAKPPLGNLRFKAPVPAEKWAGILDATKDGSACYQSDPLKNGAILGSENCLFLNVFTKHLPKNEKDLRPVLFWIHGGGLVFGSSDEELYGADVLVSADVVLVTCNYRLGLFGFLSFEDPALDIPGNAGFKDQVLALKWVQKNIKHFGGDPNNVTIFGESAGGASVHLHFLSRMSKGLFHRAIAQSGCAINPWVEGTRGCKAVAEVLGLDGVDEKTIYEILMKKSMEELLEIQFKTGDKFVPSFHRPIGLVIEKNSKEPFLDEEPIQIMHRGKFNQVPFMIGFTSAEGMCFEMFKRPDQPTELNFEDVIPWFFGYKYGSAESKSVAQKIKSFYFGNEESSQKNISKKFDLMSDCQFIYGIYVTLMTQFHVSKAPTYLYRMSVETNLNFFKKILKIEVPGVSHLDDVGYLFTHFASPQVKPGSEEDVARNKFIKLWTNFAKFGNPTPNQNDDLLKVIWKPVTGPNLDYLDIGKDLVQGVNPEAERIKFWKQLFAESPAGQKTECAFLKPSK